MQISQLCKLAKSEQHYFSKLKQSIRRKVIVRRRVNRRRKLNFTGKQVVKNIFNFVTPLKIPNNAPLTTENFDFEKLRAKALNRRRVESLLTLRFPLIMMGEILL